MPGILASRAWFAFWSSSVAARIPRHWAVMSCQWNIINRDRMMIILMVFIEFLTFAYRAPSRPVSRTSAGIDGAIRLQSVPQRASPKTTQRDMRKACPLAPGERRASRRRLDDASRHDCTRHVDAARTQQCCLVEAIFAEADIDVHRRNFIDDEPASFAFGGMATPRTIPSLCASIADIENS